MAEVRGGQDLFTALGLAYKNSRKVSMPQERVYPGLVMDRFLAHRKFYIPAYFALFFSYPGTSFLLTSEGLNWFGFGGWLFLLLAATVTALGCLFFLLQNYSDPQKILGGTIVIALGLFVECMVLRTDGVGLRFFFFIIQSKMFLTFLPILIVFVLLYLLNDIKRSRSVLVGQLVVITFLIFTNLKAFGSIECFDHFKVTAIEERVRREQYDTGSEIINECLRVVDLEKRNRCLAIAKKIPTVMESGVRDSD